MKTQIGQFPLVLMVALGLLGTHGCISDQSGSNSQPALIAVEDPSVGTSSQCDPTVSTEESLRYVGMAEYSDSLDGQAVLVSKCGEIVFEHYVSPMDVNTPHQLASGTKAFNCALFALGEADGLWTFDENVSATITEWAADERKSKILVKHLLSLSGGLIDSTEYRARDVRFLDTYALAINDSTTPYALEEAFIYAPSNFQVLAAMFERKTNGMDPVDYLYTQLFSKLGFDIQDIFMWTRDQVGKPQMGGGAYLTAREWASYGQLLLQNGQWNNEQLIDPDTLAQCIGYDNPTFRGFGLAWWLNLPTDGTYDPTIDQVPSEVTGDGNQIASNAPTDMVVAAGTGTQRLYVIPSLQLVAVRFGQTLRDPDWSDHLFMEYLLGVP